MWLRYQWKPCTVAITQDIPANVSVHCLLPEQRRLKSWMRTCSCWTSVLSPSRNHVSHCTRRWRSASRGQGAPPSWRRSWYAILPTPLGPFTVFIPSYYIHFPFCMMNVPLVPNAFPEKDARVFFICMSHRIWNNPRSGDPSRVSLCA